MKKIMAMVAFLTFGVVACNAALELVTIGSGNIEKYEYLKEFISQNSEKKVLPGSEQNIQHVQSTIWDEVAEGSRNLLVALDGEQYAGHMFFIVHKDQDRIRIGVPGCKDQSQFIQLLTLFLDDLRKLGSFDTGEVINEIIFTVPQDMVSYYQPRINYFGFVEDPSVAIEGLAEKCVKYGYDAEQAQTLAWFVLRKDVVLPTV